MVIRAATAGWLELLMKREHLTFHSKLTNQLLAAAAPLGIADFLYVPHSVDTHATVAAVMTATAVVLRACSFTHYVAYNVPA
jgi:hypothetical protein